MSVSVVAAQKGGAGRTTLVDGAYESAERVVTRPLPPWPQAELWFVLNVTRDPVLERPEFLALRQRLGYPGNG